MTRRYDMRRRSRGAALTRSAIVDAAYALLDAKEASGLTLDEVARAAGVSRATIYNQFASRRELLATVFEDVGRRIRYDRVQRAEALADPRHALLAMLRELGRAWSVRPRVRRRILALGVIDPEIGDVNDRYERYRRATMAAFASRLAEAGLLGHGLTASDAAGILAALTSPQFFDVLRAGRTVRVATETLVHIASTSLGITLDQEHGHGRAPR